MKILERLQRERPLEFHERMHEMFNEAVYVFSLVLNLLYTKSHFFSGPIHSENSDDLESSAFSIIDF